MLTGRMMRATGIASAIAVGQGWLLLAEVGVVEEVGGNRGMI